MKKTVLVKDSMEEFKEENKKSFNNEVINHKKIRQRYRTDLWHKNNPDRRIYTTQKSNAKRRGIRFTLTLEEYKLLRGGPCYYCGDTYSYIGVDRVNNEIGYHIDNVVKCCIKCNRAKSHYSADEYIERCKRVATRFAE